MKLFRLIVAYLFLSSVCGTSNAAVTTDNIKYGTTTAITITLNSLGASTTAGRSSASVDNSSNLCIDAYVTVISSTSNSALSGGKVVNVYAYGSEDGTNFDAEEGAQPGSDASYTINAITLFRFLGQLPVATSGKQYIKTFAISNAFNGVVPRKWGIIVTNDTGQSLAASGNSASYSCVTYTNQ